jgi:hypothetical protein
MWPGASLLASLASNSSTQHSKLGRYQYFQGWMGQERCSPQSADNRDPEPGLAFLDIHQSRASVRRELINRDCSVIAGLPR